MSNQLAGIATIELPPGFEKSTEDCDFGHFIEFRSTNSRICYWQKDNFFAPPDVAQTLESALKRRPHYLYKRNPKVPDEPRVQEDEYFAAADALLQPGRVLPPYGFDIRALRTTVLNGKTIFRADFDCHNFFSSIVFWDATPESGMLRHLWIEGPLNKEEELQKEFEKVCDTIQWV